MIYLDHAATSPPRRAVLEAAWPYLTAVTANPASVHEPGRAARAALEGARERAAAVLGVRPGEVVFTSGGTEADNLAVLGIARAAAAATGRRHVVTTAVEHAAVLEPARALVREGFTLDVVGVDGDGVVDLDHLAAVLTDRTALCAVVHANNEVGTVQPLAEVAALCRPLGVVLHTDAVQSAGQLPVRLDDLGVDSLAVSGHKLGGLRGAGLLAVRGAVPLEPVLHGGGQERGRRSGTADVASAVAAAAALALADAARPAEAPRLTALRDRLLAGVLGLVPGARVTGHRTQRLPNSASVVLPGVGGELVLAELDAAGVVCSSGSACSAESEDASHVLTAMGLDADLARTALRFSLGPETTADDVDAVLALLPGVLAAAGPVR
ncbi:MAG: Cysteine desulfurase [uncultured Quadrisphaera sp.]|uniref:Cysteine desulfurase n=1 Tax=uncultured Quadrisphaera sp. TaxID=904978 RepID=A0A6J4QFE3_9ACTN|nr:MAG: Cysteine desulfurase [uncultured Quadrisphaera sp.]